jgi:hypothetical protein
MPPKNRVDLPSWVKNESLADKQEKGFVALLEDLKDDSKLKEILDDAIAGEFSDFGSSLATPLMILYQCLSEKDRGDLALKVTKGTYDHGYVHYKPSQ